MKEAAVAPYGSWKSPITTDLIVRDTISLGGILTDGEDLYWIEVRYTEGGRYVIVRRTPDGQIHDILPEPFNARTTVHEYGGRAYLVVDGTVYFSNFPDQRLYAVTPGAAPQPITPEADLRYADYVFDRPRNRLITVREDHSGQGEAVNILVAIDLPQGGPGQVLVSGSDFYSSPRVSPDGSRLAWLAWDHPNMPWDGTELWMADIRADGGLGQRQRVAGGEAESIFQPEWSPDGRLYFVSDRTGWWNLYRWQEGQTEALHPMKAEFGAPQWGFGMSFYDFESAERMICQYSQGCNASLAALNLSTGQFEPITTPYNTFWIVKVKPGAVFFGAASPTEPDGLHRLDLQSGRIDTLRRSSEIRIDPGYLSIPEEIEFPTEGGLTAYGIFYAPRNAGVSGPPDERPPLLVMSHGGPTGAASNAFNLEIQYWTSRGIAVLDVNYGGSTGYGRAYRERLNGQWGVVDVDDCVNGARYLAELGRVDGNRMAITGGSAGGYTTLCALTFRDVFKAGASHFGIGDLETFVHDTHKFESRYLERLVGPYPERKDLYHQRSPIHAVARLAVPLILFQGLEDKIVPPNQAQAMFAAVKSKGLPVAYLPFAGEQHGFRRAENIQRALEAELYFYSKMFSFALADPIEPVEIENF